MYNLHSQHGQFSGCQFLISFLKTFKDFSLNSPGTIFQMIRPKNEILPVEQKTLLTFGN